jgi:LacI family transcriptional regulator
MPRARKPVTVKDVARAANVSPATAARALNGYGYVGSAAAERVSEAAQRLGYRGNRVAQALRKGQLPIIGFVSGDIQNPFFARIAHGVDVALRRGGHNLLFASSEEDADQERGLVGSLRALNVCGLIVATASGDDFSHLEHLLEEGFPLVLVDRAPPNFACDSVLVDNEGGIGEAVDALVRQGHHRIALLRDESRIITARERRAGYIGALQRHGISLDDRLVAMSKSNVGCAMDATTRLFGNSEPPTAIVTVDSIMTTGVVLALRSLGLSIPHDVSLIGFDDFDMASFTEPPISVVSQPVDQIGPAAVEMLMDRIHGSTEPPRCVRFPTVLIERGSVATPLTSRF